MLIGPRSWRTLYRTAVTSTAILALAAVQPRAMDEASRKETEEWRKKHEADYRREYVPLAGLFSLKNGLNTAGSGASNNIVLPRSAPPVVGRFVLEGQTVRFESQPGVQVLLKGRPVTGSVTLRSDASEELDELAIGPLSLWVHISGERPTIRMRDPDGETARSFSGFQWFPIDDSYRVVGRFIKDAAPREIRAPNQLGDEDVMQSEGVVEFRLHGESVRLRPMTTRPNRFWFIFRDGTSGKETYETARFLYADLRPDGTAVLDFNQAYNPPCAFNPYTTCPIPLPENRLTVRILAGEKAYGQK
ncbi:MAG TPA: DUF1684 domain-containing protein [Vicinamibacterales bacterium]|nr:DUF1684 domain-containing protein [Vicinamibacterales bacterium]